MFCMYSKAGTAFLLHLRKTEYYKVFPLFLLSIHALYKESNIEKLLQVATEDPVNK